MIIRVRTPDGRVLDRNEGPMRPYIVRSSRGAVPLTMGSTPQGNLYLRPQHRKKKAFRLI